MFALTREKRFDLYARKQSVFEITQADLSSCDLLSIYEGHSKNTQNSPVTRVPARKNVFWHASHKKHVLCNRIIAITHFALVNEVVKS